MKIVLQAPIFKGDNQNRNFGAFVYFYRLTEVKALHVGQRHILCVVQVPI